MHIGEYWLMVISSLHLVVTTSISFHPSIAYPSHLIPLVMSFAHIYPCNQSPGLSSPTLSPRTRLLSSLLCFHVLYHLSHHLVCSTARAEHFYLFTPYNHYLLPLTYYTRLTFYLIYCFPYPITLPRLQTDTQQAIASHYIIHI